MTTKDEIINKLIRSIGKEIDYWTLDSNRDLREEEYGVITYNKMFVRFEDIKRVALDAVISLVEINAINDGSKKERRRRERQIKQKKLVKKMEKLENRRKKKAQKFGL